MCLCLTRQPRLIGRCLVKNRVGVSGGFRLGRGAASQHCYGAIRAATLLLLTDGRVWCMCAFLPTLGGGLCFVGGREAEFEEEEEAEKCGERSAEAQLVRPPLQPAAASDGPVSDLPASLVFLFLSHTTRNPPLSCPPPRRLSPAVPSSLLSSPATLHPDPEEKKHSHICKQVCSKVSQECCGICKGHVDARGWSWSTSCVWALQAGYCWGPGPAPPSPQRMPFKRATQRVLKVLCFKKLWILSAHADRGGSF